MKAGFQTQIHTHARTYVHAYVHAHIQQQDTPLPSHNNCTQWLTVQTDSRAAGAFTVVSLYVLSDVHKSSDGFDWLHFTWTSNHPPTYESWDPGCAIDYGQTSAVLCDMQSWKLLQVTPFSHVQF